MWTVSNPVGGPVDGWSGSGLKIPESVVTWWTGSLRALTSDAATSHGSWLGTSHLGGNISTDVEGGSSANLWPDLPHSMRCSSILVHFTIGRSEGIQSITILIVVWISWPVDR